MIWSQQNTTETQTDAPNSLKSRACSRKQQLQLNTMGFQVFTQKEYSVMIKRNRVEKARFYKELLSNVFESQGALKKNLPKKKKKLATCLLPCFHNESVKHTSPHPGDKP